MRISRPVRIAGAALAVVVGFGAFVTRKQTRISHEDEVRRLETLLPSGTPAIRVESVLDSLHIDHGPYDPATHQIDGMDQNTAHDWLIETSLRIELRFDSEGRLVSRTVEDVYTGP